MTGESASHALEDAAHATLLAVASEPGEVQVLEREAHQDRHVASAPGSEPAEVVGPCIDGRFRHVAAVVTQFRAHAASEAEPSLLSQL